MAEVYLIYQNRLFGDVVRAVLATYPEIKLLGATDLAHVTSRDVVALAPAVILFEEVDGSPAIAAANHLLTGLGRCRLITLHADHGGMHVWRGTWQETVEPGDLVNAITDAWEDGP